MEAVLTLALIALAVWAVVAISKKTKANKPQTYIDPYRHSVNCECRECLKNLPEHHWR
jgi:hypothetical protein